MYRRIQPVLAIFILGLALVCWLRRPVSALQKSLPAPVPLASVKLATSPQVAAPVAPAVSPTASPLASSAPSDPNAIADPKVKINALLDKTVGLVKANDLNTVFETLIAPGEFDRIGPIAKQQMEDALQIHQGTPELGVWISVLQQMKDLTPTYNDAGDEATYAIQDPTGRGISLRPVVLKKVNNEWYFSGVGVLKGVIGYGLLVDPPLQGI